MYDKSGYKQLVQYLIYVCENCGPSDKFLTIKLSLGRLFSSYGAQSDQHPSASGLRSFSPDGTPCFTSLHSIIGMRNDLRRRGMSKTSPKGIYPARQLIGCASYFKRKLYIPAWKKSLRYPANGGKMGTRSASFATYIRLANPITSFVKPPGNLTEFKSNIYHMLLAKVMLTMQLRIEPRVEDCLVTS